MKEWWSNLSLREKQMVGSGSIVIILFLLYEILWSPLVDANDNLRIRIPHNRETLQSMQSADQRIQSLLKTSQQKTGHAAESLLGTLQTEIKQSTFASHLVQLREAENDSVQFNLRKINFDQLIIFLDGLWKKHSFIVSQITVVPTGAPGEVTVDVVMTA